MTTRIVLLVPCLEETWKGVSECFVIGSEVAAFWIVSRQAHKKNSDG